MSVHRISILLRIDINTCTCTDKQFEVNLKNTYRCTGVRLLSIQIVRKLRERSKLSPQMTISVDAIKQ